MTPAPARPNPLTETHTRVAATRYSRNGWEVVKCVETGMVYLANPPDYSSLTEEYSWDKTYKLEKQRRKESEPVITMLSNVVKSIRRRLRPRDRIVSQSEKILRQIQKESGRETMTLLDVGCGIADKAGAITRCMSENFSVTICPIGIEIGNDQAEQANRVLSPLGGHCIRGSAIEGMNAVEDGSIDLIILCSFLEHEVNPLPLLRACAVKLKQRGRVVIKVPNFGSLNRRIRQRKWCGFRYPDHVNYFTPATLTRLIEASGMALLRMNFLDRLPTSDNMWAVAGRKLPREGS